MKPQRFEVGVALGTGPVERIRFVCVPRDEWERIRSVVDAAKAYRRRYYATDVDLITAVDALEGQEQPPDEFQRGYDAGHADGYADGRRDARHDDTVTDEMRAVIDAAKRFAHEWPWTASNIAGDLIAAVDALEES